MILLFDTRVGVSGVTKMQHTVSANEGLSLGVSIKHQILGAVALGIALVFIVGFVPVSAFHNAAHDVRHTMAFPCH